MVNFRLEITAELENLTNFQPQGGSDNPDLRYFFKMKCGNCGEVTEKETCVCLSEVVALPRGKGTANLVQKVLCQLSPTLLIPFTYKAKVKCKFCGRNGSVLMIPGQGKPLTLASSEGGKYTPMMFFDCRGFEPLEFSFGSVWEAESTSGTKFIDINLSDGEYAEYDEDGQFPVGISNLKAKFVTVK